MKISVVIIVMAALLGLSAYFVIANRSNSSNIVTQGSQTFVGTINRSTLSPQNLTGIEALSDEGCAVDSSGMSNCTTKLNTKYGIISFNYRHNETLKPCISLGDIVNIQIKEGGVAILTRTYQNLSNLNSNQSLSCKS
jgi:hypothetical protein